MLCPLSGMWLFWWLLFRFLQHWHFRHFNYYLDELHCHWRFGHLFWNPLFKVTLWKLMWASAHCIRFYNNPAPVNRSTQFHYCTITNPGTGADDAFVLKRGVWRNATWPSHSRQCVPFSNLFSPLIFWPLVCLPTLCLPSPFYALSHV